MAVPRWRLKSFGKECLLLVFLPVLALASGCTKGQPNVAPPKPPEVDFEHPVIAQVRDYEDFTGRTESIPTVTVQARVTGELSKVNFEDGAEVNKGDLLFEIDSRGFTAALKSAEATVHQMRGDLKRKRILLDRTQELRKKGTNTQEDLDNAQADFDVATALLELAEANRRTAQLNLEYCTIRAAESGRIDRHMLDVGNQITANTSILTTIRGMNPIYANFDLDERTLLRVRRLLLEGKIDSARDTGAKLDIGLADEENFSLKGVIDFSSNALDAGTGTLRIRVRIDNFTEEENIGRFMESVLEPAQEASHLHASVSLSKRRLLQANMFVRIRFYIGNPADAIMVPESALVSDQGVRHLFVLGPEDKDGESKVEYRAVEIGLQQGSMRVIKNGVTPSDRVIVNGLQRVRANVKVTATERKKAVPSMASTKKVVTNSGH